MLASAVDVAVIVSAEAVDGAVKTVLPPLAVCGGSNVPVAAPVQDQSTPASVSSLKTIAVRLTDWPRSTKEGMLTI